MPDEFHTSLISDFRPRPITSDYKRREIAFVRRPPLNYGRSLDNVLPSAPSSPRFENVPKKATFVNFQSSAGAEPTPLPYKYPDSHPPPQGLFHWSPKYLGGLMVAVAVLFIIGSRANDSAPLAASTTIPHKQVEVKQAMVNYGLPARLKIPKINVDATLDYVGLTPQGELGVPKGPDSAAWYDLGPRPGEMGNSVIDGHFGYQDHIPAVFDNLHKLQKGDSLYVEDEKGATVTFVVRELRTYAHSEDDSGIFYSSDGKAHLNLITCQGVWSETQKSFSNRLVVFADKEG